MASEGSLVVLRNTRREVRDGQGTGLLVSSTLCSGITMELFRRLAPGQSHGGWRLHSGRGLIKHLNQEDLCKPNPLLLLLNARGRTLPDSNCG